MKRLICLCLTLVIVAGIAATGRGVVTRPRQLVISAEPVVDLPAVDLTVQDIIGFLSEYDVQHMGNKVFCRQFYGLTSFDDKLINLCANVDSMQQKLTLLHELYHIKYRQLGIYTGGPYEPLIEKLAEAKFVQLFGFQQTIPPASPEQPAK